MVQSNGCAFSLSFALDKNEIRRSNPTGVARKATKKKAHHDMRHLHCSRGEARLSAAPCLDFIVSKRSKRRPFDHIVWGGSRESESEDRHVKVSRIRRPSTLRSDSRAPLRGPRFSLDESRLAPNDDRTPPCWSCGARANPRTSIAAAADDP